MKRMLSILLVTVLLLAACGQTAPVGSEVDSTGTLSWQEQYDLGMRYLSEGNYAEAIIAFTTAIEIEPKRSAAYEGLADAYIGSGDMESAIKALEDGIANTNDTALQKKLEDLKQLQSTAETEELSVGHFSEADLEEWGYPIGLSIYDLISRGEADESDLQELEENRDASWAGRSAAHGVSKSPTVFVKYYNGLIASVDIDENDPSTGPRGVALGMQIHEVLQLFRCDNADLLKLGYYDLMQMLEADEYIYVYRDDRMDEITGVRTGYYDSLFFIGRRNDVPYLALSYEFVWPSNTRAWLNIGFTEAGVSNINVHYQYE